MTRASAAHPAAPAAFVVHWSEGELPAKVAQVAACGLRVVGSESADGARAYAQAKDLEPDVLVVWLSRLPSHGRVTAASIRGSGWGRDLPVVFVDGDPDRLEAQKMRQLKDAVPDAVVATPKTLAARLRTLFSAQTA